MKKLVFFSFIISILAAASCKKDSPVSAKSSKTDSCMVMDTIPVKDTTKYEDGYTIKSDTVTGDNLHLVVTYGGGCAEHDFRLVYNQLAMPAFPVVHLEHNAHKDLCKALITKNLCFDISYFRKQSGQAHGSVWFPLFDGQNSSLNVNYRW